jgi:hypothetical protein
LGLGGGLLDVGFDRGFDGLGFGVTVKKFGHVDGGDFNLGVENGRGEREQKNKGFSEHAPILSPHPLLASDENKTPTEIGVERGL